MLTVADENTPMAVHVVPGQTQEASHRGPTLDAMTARVGNLEEAVADKAFEGQPRRQAFRDRNSQPVIPSPPNCLQGGRLDKKAYGERNRIERLFGKLKEFRRVATRYKKLKQTFPGIVHRVLGFIRLKRLGSSTEPSSLVYRTLLVSCRKGMWS